MGAVLDRTLSLPWAIIHRAVVPVAFYFPLAPQRARFTFPSRGAVHQTVGGNYLDDFSGDGSVLAQAELRGTFGYAPRAGGAIGVPTPGSVTLKQLELIYETFNALDRQLKRDAGAVTEFVCLPRQYFWRVWIKDFGIDASAQDPLLWYYRMTIIRLEDYLSPVGLAKKVAGALGAIGDGIGGLLGSGSWGVAA